MQLDPIENALVLLSDREMVTVWNVKLLSLQILSENITIKC